jgi:uncharacterized protein
MIDRISPLQRPTGMPIMYQTWAKLLFLHWPVAPEQLRPMVPERLTIDTHWGSAWASLTPFTMWGIRPPFLPAVPRLSATHELNVRTYVLLNGVPGVWFFTLEAANVLAVVGAQVFFGLPYRLARMRLWERDDTIRYRSRRIHPGSPPAHFDAEWRGGDALPASVPGSPEFFLTERYYLYTTKGDRLLRGRIHHPPWPLQRATLRHLDSTMLQAHGITPEQDAPLLHQQREPIEVEIWRLETV